MEIQFTQDLQQQIAVFVLVLFRLTGLFISAPFFSGSFAPRRLKVLFAACTTVCIAPNLYGQGPAVVAALDQPVSAILAVASELTIGFAIGFVASVVLSAIQTAGYIVAQDMGITIANVIDPLSNIQVSVFGQLKTTVALVVFLLLDFHHHLIRILVYSFSLIPLGAFVHRTVDPALGGQLEKFSSQQGHLLFDAAVRLALPATVTLLLVSVAMAFLARAVPEMNIFIIGFALRIMVGLWVILLVFPFLVEAFKALFERMVRDQWSLIHALSG